MDRRLLQGMKWKHYLDSMAILQHHQEYKAWDKDLSFEVMPIYQSS